VEHLISATEATQQRLRRSVDCYGDPLAEEGDVHDLRKVKRAKRGGGEGKEWREWSVEWSGVEWMAHGAGAGRRGTPGLDGLMFMITPSLNPPHTHTSTRCCRASPPPRRSRRKEKTQGARAGGCWHTDTSRRSWSWPR
jgi:hypothetical protein